MMGFRKGKNIRNNEARKSLHECNKSFLSRFMYLTHKNNTFIVITIFMLFGLLAQVFLPVTSIYAAPQGPNPDGSNISASDSPVYQNRYNAYWRAKSWMYYNAISACLDSSLFYPSQNKSLSGSDMKNGDWFTTGGWTVQGDNRTDSIKKGSWLEQIIDKTDDGQIFCGENNNALVKNALNLWGISAIDLGCNGNNSRIFKGSDTDNDEPCQSSDYVYLVSNPSNVLKQYLKQTVYANSSPASNDLDKLPDATKYSFFRNNFLSTCAVNKTKYLKKDDVTSSSYEIKELDSNGEIRSVWYQSNPNKIDNTVYMAAGGGWTDSCANIAKELNKKDGLIVALKANYDARSVAIQEGYYNSSGESSGDDVGGGSDTSTSCNVDGIGWLVCPVVTFLDSATNMMYSSIVEPFLSVNASQWFSDSGDLQKGWAAVRDIANVVIVIILMLVIISQISGIGISNYGIKKILPKLIIVSILVNISFWVCALAVDLSNILGEGTYSMAKGLSGSTAGAPSTTFGGGGFMGAVGGITAVLALGAAAVFFTGAILSVIALTLMVTWVSLVGRQVILIVLIVFSPLAFATMILPNTESWFKRWRKMMTTLLMMYPIIGGILGISGFASEIIQNTSTAGGGMESWLLNIGGAAIAVVPLIAIPTILKKTMTGLEGVGGAIGKLQGSLGGVAGKGGKKAGDYGSYGLRKTGRWASKKIGESDSMQKFAGGKIGGRLNSARNKVGGAYAGLRRLDASVANYGTELAEERKQKDAQSIVDYSQRKGVGNLSPVERRQFLQAQAAIDKQEQLENASQASGLVAQVSSLNTSSGQWSNYTNWAQGKFKDVNSAASKLAYLSSAGKTNIGAMDSAAKKLGLGGGDKAAARSARIASAFDSATGTAEDRAKLMTEFRNTTLGSEIKSSSPALHDFLSDELSEENTMKNGLQSLSGNIDTVLENHQKAFIQDKSKENLYNNLSNEKLANVNDREAGIALESGLINDKRAYDFIKENNGKNLNSFDNDTSKAFMAAAERYVKDNPGISSQQQGQDSAKARSQSPGRWRR